MRFAISPPRLNRGQTLGETQILRAIPARPTRLAQGPVQKRGRSIETQILQPALALYLGPLLLFVACAAALPQPTAVDLELARADDPNTALEDLQRGRDAYARRCSSCHALRAPAERAPEDWPAEVARMQTAHRVQLTTDEARDIIRYLRAASAHAQQAAK
jgi:mono/diheme cytochrome c family protein